MEILTRLLDAFPRILKEVWEEENRQKYEEFVEKFEDTTILMSEMVEIATYVLFDIYKAATDHGEPLDAAKARRIMSPEQERLYDAFKDKMIHIKITN